MRVNNPRGKEWADRFCKQHGPDPNRRKGRADVSVSNSEHDGREAACGGSEMPYFVARKRGGGARWRGDCEDRKVGEVKYNGVEVQQQPRMADLKCEERDHSGWRTWCGRVMIEHAFREPPVKRTIPVDSRQLAKTSVDFLAGSEARSRM
ncbi:hypothetical protein F2Q69_00016095 [Brassica cretica]|uniref:Uncharacterized protein n=1 Tax=Brassica cretica TaxID=69181 RepID=A0A8S9R526_BRACR|nr:hypothetical protein F2Q69_00016095 [Brassica cretica]